MEGREGLEEEEGWGDGFPQKLETREALARKYVSDELQTIYKGCRSSGGETDSAAEGSKEKGGGGTGSSLGTASA